MITYYPISNYYYLLPPVIVIRRAADTTYWLYSVLPPRYGFDILSISSPGTFVTVTATAELSSILEKALAGT